MHYLYGWSWHPKRRHPIREMDEAKAREAFAKGPQLGVTALPEPGGVPAYTLEMSAHAQHVRVVRYAPEGSTAANIHYAVPEDEDRLFLQQVSEWLYPDDGEYHSMMRAKAFRQYLFSPDGTAEVRSRLAGAEAESVEQFTDVDVSDHWLDRITWGDWDRIGFHQPTATGPGQ